METHPEQPVQARIPASASGTTVPEPGHDLPGPMDNSLMPGRAPSKEQRRAIIEEHIAWIKANSPGWEIIDPFAIDWQTVKSVGREY
jgi:hypothetical protein